MGNFTLGDTSRYFKPSEGILNGPNSLTTSGSPDPTLWQKTKGKVGALFDTGKKDLGTLYNDVDFDSSENDELLGVIADTEGEIASTSGKEEGADWEAISRMLQSIKPNQESNRISTGGGRVGGGFKFDRNPYENKLLTREYENLYNQPLYK